MWLTSVDCIDVTYFSVEQFEDTGNFTTMFEVKPFVNVTAGMDNFLCFLNLLKLILQIINRASLPSVC